MCDHPAWLQVSRRPALCFSTTSRLESINNSLTDPDKQYPGLVLGLGRRVRDQAFKELFPNNNFIRKGRDPAFANIFVENTTFSSRHPLLFATSDTTALLSTQQTPTSCHLVKTHFAEWTDIPDGRSSPATILNRLLLPFCDVLCLFVEDYGSLDAVLGLLGHWIRQGTSSQHVLPHVLVVSTSECSQELSVQSQYPVVQDLSAELSRETPIDYTYSFCSVDHVVMADGGLSPRSRFRPLKDLILKRMDQARLERLRKRCLFSATHFAALFENRVPQFAKHATTIFDTITTSREGVPVPVDRQSFLTIFLKCCSRYNLPYLDIIEPIASTILLHAYPPFMHRFDPAGIFETLFEADCFAALKSVYESSSFAQEICASIKAKLKEHFAHLEAGSSAAVIHRAVVGMQKDKWMKVKTNQCCLYCIAAKPEHVLACGHSICDNCVRIFGEADKELEHCYNIGACILCKEPTNLKVVLKPPTAGVRILSVDGGGVRGIVPLEFLHLLQQKLGAQCKVQDMFDLAVGTSAGGLITLGLFLKRWDVAHCIRLFRVMTSHAFGKPRSSGRSKLARLRHLFKGLMTDGCYSTANIEKVLQDSFGLTQTLFDHPVDRCSRAKVAVTATTISDAVTFLFSNYNGEEKRDHSAGYKHFRPSDTAGEAQIWQAARATSAAPMFFRPADLPSIGTFQDGGLRHNNPINLALWECSKIWPAGTAQDVVLSLGTGSELTEPQLSPQAPAFRHILSDGFIPRLCRIFMSSLDGELAWRDLANRLTKDVKGNFFRFNIQFKGKEPEIDDIGCMDALVETVEADLAREPRLNDVAIALLISCFFFELNLAPRFEDGLWRCDGSIRCRMEPRFVVNAIRQLLKAPLRLLITAEAPLLFDLEQCICPGCHRLVQPLSFTVRHPEEKVSLEILFGKARRSVSGFPQTMAWFTEKQNLHSPFGRRDHAMVSGQSCHTCKSAPSNGARRLAKRKQREATIDLETAKRVRFQ